MFRGERNYLVQKIRKSSRTEGIGLGFEALSRFTDILRVKQMNIPGGKSNMIKVMKSGELVK